MMNKTLVVAAVVAALGVGYWYNSDESSRDGFDEKDISFLKQVPADTLFFSASFDPFPIKDYIDATPSSYTTEEVMNAFSAVDDSPTSSFFASLVRQYLVSMQSGEQFVKTFGLKERAKFVSYAVGMIPVFKVELADPAAFWQVLDTAEKNSGIALARQSQGDQTIRTLVVQDDANQPFANLVFEVEKGWLTIAIMPVELSDKDGKIALGQTAPKTSLADVTKITEMYKQYPLEHSNITYVDFKQLATALTTKDGNLLAQQLNQLGDSELNSELAAFHTPQCQTEVGAIAANWPYWIGGTTDLQISNKHVNMKTASYIPSNNKVILDALMQTKGVLAITSIKMMLFCH
ncbi:hypothetical protein [Shewanella marina]|uniref:hypothetical protein n=1 Tax=Shewanella marina TaxID=487319 RepID=UPI000471FBC1|nr:hypothetical protein [Shewanella marina]